MSKRIANIGLMTALAMIFSYVEAMLPINFGIPGVKIGIANLVVVSGIYILNIKDVWMISMIRIFLMGLLFGNGVSLIYSLSGGVLSLLVMMLLKKSGIFSITGVSVAGAVSHNIGQLIAASVVIGNLSIFYYFPVLLIAGVVMGIIIGMLSGRILTGVKPEMNN